MNTHTPTQRLVDRLIPGGIDKLVHDMRTAEASWYGIAREIEHRTRERVTANTVRRWYETENRQTPAA